jgi:GNAT superfamily N-acetyltransferase
MAALSDLDVSLRPAVEDDVAFLKTLRRLSMGPHHDQAGIPESPDVNEARVRARLECAKVICVAGRPVGVLKVVDQEATVSIMQLQLLPEVQGQGIGAELVSSVLQQARAVRKPVTLSVLKVNPARRLYERLGFHVTDEDEHSFHMVAGEA